MATLFTLIAMAMLTASTPLVPAAAELREGKFYETGSGHLYTGMYYKTFENSTQIEATGKLKNGVMDGTWSFYYANGNLHKKAVFESGRELRVLNSWYYGGQRESEFNTENEIDSVFYRNGKLKSVTKYAGYCKQGTCVEWYESGHVKREYVYYDHLEHGICNDFYEDGRLALKATYSNGKESGIWEAYYTDGRLKYKGRYSGGFKVGKWFERQEDGKLTRKMY